MELLAGALLLLKLAAGGVGVFFLRGLISQFCGDQTTKDLLRHTYTIGETGTGKSTKCMNDIINVIKQGYGCLYIDIHGKDSRELLDCIPDEHLERVIYIDPSNVDSVIGFPIFDGDDELAVDALISVFDVLWPGFIGPSTEDILRMSALAVVPNKGSLLEIYLMIVDENYRSRVEIKDEAVKQFWYQTFPELIKKDKSRLNPPTNKLRKLVMSRICRLSLCQQSPQFDLLRSMADNKIIICNFAKGKIGHDTSRLLSALMVCKLQLCTFIRNESSTPFFCFLDEFQNYVTKSFPEILSESRKYNISLNLYHQYFHQVPDYLQHAIRGNVGSRYAFRGEDDAKLVAEMFDVQPEDIKNLENYWYYCKRLVNGKKEKTAKKILSDAPPKQYGHSKEIIYNSRKYGTPPEIILKDVRSRMKSPDTMEDEIV